MLHSIVITAIKQLQLQNKHDYETMRQPRL